MKTFTIQESFNFLMANQNKLGNKIALLADLWGASRLTVEGKQEEVTTTSRKAIKTIAKKVVAKIKRRHKVAKKVARSSTIIYDVPNIVVPTLMDNLIAFGDKLARKIGLGTSLSLLSVETLARLSLLKGGSKELKTLLAVSGQIVRMATKVLAA